MSKYSFGCFLSHGFTDIETIVRASATTSAIALSAVRPFARQTAVTSWRVAGVRSRKRRPMRE